jgi:hypothetical protein
MKHSFYKRIILIVVLALCSISCSSDLDFDQANDFSAQPVVTTNLAYYEAKATEFQLAGTGAYAYSYVAKVDFLNTSFIEDNLIKAEFYFRIKNTIARGFIFSVIFLDKNNVPIYTIPPMNVAEYTGTEVLFERTETFTPANVAVLKNTTKMVFSITMLPGQQLTAASPGRIELSSSATAYFDVR